MTASTDFGLLADLNVVLSNYWLALAVATPILLPVGFGVGLGLGWLMGRGA